jgi:hypothetical protein
MQGRWSRHSGLLGFAGLTAVDCKRSFRNLLKIAETCRDDRIIAAMRHDRLRPDSACRALWRLAGRSAIRCDVETPEADSRAIDRVEPADAAGDRRAAGERPPHGRENAFDTGGPKNAAGGGIGFRAGADRGDAGDWEAGQRCLGAVGAARSIQVWC